MVCFIVAYTLVSYTTAVNWLPMFCRATHNRKNIHTYIQYSTVQYSTVQYSTVQYSTVQYSTVDIFVYMDD